MFPVPPALSKKKPQTVTPPTVTTTTAVTASLPLKIAQARLLATFTRPYFSAALCALRFKAVSGLGTLAVDAGHCCYYDPDAIERWSVPEICTVMIHEVMHNLMDHHNRCRELGGMVDQTTWNIAADAEINDGMVREADLKFPDVDFVLPSKYGLPDDKLAEWYYGEIMKKQYELPVTPGPGGNGGSGGQQSPTGNGTDNSNDNDSDTKQDGGGGGGGQKPGDDQRSCGGGAGSPGDGGTSSGTPSPSDGSTSPGTYTGRKPRPLHGNCGSCAVLSQQEWEDGIPGVTTDGDGTSKDHISQIEMDLIRKEVARQIREHSRTKGNIGGGWARWAEEQLKPKVNYWKVIRAAVKASIDIVSGYSDYSYMKPSRKQHLVPDVIHPVPVGYRPRIGILIDTSGSMSDTQLGQAVAEVKGVLNTIGQSKVDVFACDAIVHKKQSVFKASDIQLVGGGGTDMRVGLKQMATIKPKYDLVICMTDCYTDWPSQKPPFELVVIALGAGNKPAFPCRVVEVPMDWK